MGIPNWTARAAVVCSACALLLTAGSAQAAAISVVGPNVLVNGGFESSPAPNLGDNVNPATPGYPTPHPAMSPWRLIGSNGPIIVKVDGPGGPAYASGPQSDASNSPAGVERRYLAFTPPVSSFSNAIIQTYTAACTGPVRLSARFAWRPSPPPPPGQSWVSTGSVRLRLTPNINLPGQGQVMGASPTVNPTQNGGWVEASATANVVAGVTYHVELYSSRANVDEISLNYTSLNCVPVSQATGGAVLNAAVLNTLGPVDTLSNGGFEADPPPSLGNNLVSSIPAWTTTPSGVLRNIVRVDGSGPFHYTTGPQMDASGVGGLRHYFRFNTQGGGQIYQSFTARCSGQATVRGYFSSRRSPTGQSVAGNGAITLRSGQGPGGTLLDQATVVNYANANFWTQRAVTAALVQGEDYTVVVALDGALHFDEATLAYPASCPTPVGTGSGAGAGRGAR